MPSLKVDLFNLAATIESGQLFRFEKRASQFIISHGDEVFCVSQEGDRLRYSGIDQTKLSDFLRLDEDHIAVQKDINKDIWLNEAIQKYSGLRLARQDPWECLIGFVCSSASNIPKIRMNLENISRHFGTPRSFGGDVRFTFPKPGKIDDLDLIRKSKAGFRADYIHKINQVVDRGFLDGLRDLPYDEAKKELTSLPGVGSKVADCVLLFSLGFDEAFPIDTWVQRIMGEFYLPKGTSHDRMQVFARDYFGPRAGYAQQYLFHWRRNLP